MAKANHTLTITIPDKLDPKLLNVKGKCSYFEHYFIIVLISSFLLTCIFLSCYVIYSTINDSKSNELIAFIDFLMGFMAVFCGFCLIRLATFWNKINYIEITDKGIFYSEYDMLDGWIENNIYWKNLPSNQQVNIVYKRRISHRSIPISYVDFFPLLIPTRYFTRFYNTKELVRAFILNLANIHKNVTFSEQVFYFFDIDEEIISNPPKMLINPEVTSAKQETLQSGVIEVSSDIQQQLVTSGNQPVTKHAERRKVERSLVWLCSVLIVISCLVVISMHLNLLVSTFLMILFSISSVVVVLTVTSKQINRVLPRHQRVAYHIKEQQVSNKDSLKDE